MPVHTTEQVDARVVLDLFRACFAREDITADDDFFALGGDSLAAGRLLTRLYEISNVDLPPDALFRNPTPRALAEAVAGPASDAGVDRWASLVPLNRHGRGLPIVLVHPTSGNPWVFRPLVEHARFTRPVFATRAPDLDWDCDVLTIAEMAQHYAIEIRRLQRRGPYSLAGYSFGGNLAFEIANRLVADGQEVEHLVMFDTPGPHTMWSRITSVERLLTAMRRRLCQTGWLGARLLDLQGFSSPPRRAFLCFGTGPMTTRELRRLLQIAFPAYARQHDLRHATLPELCATIVELVKPVVTTVVWEYLIRRAPSEDAVTLVKAHKVWAKNQWLGLEHKPRGVFPGTITIFACHDSGEIERWRRYSSKPLDVRRIPVAHDEHSSLLEERLVGVFAEDLKHLLEGRPS